MCLFDRQMVLLDQLKQFVVKMFGYWFVIQRGGVVYIFVSIRGLKLAAQSYFVAPSVKARLGVCADRAHLAI